jgi:hypothetical protein
MARLIWYASGGIGNRVPSMLSVYLWSRHLNREFFVVWPRGSDCEVDFAELFEWGGDRLNFVDANYIDAFDDLAVCTDKRGSDVVENRRKTGTQFFRLADLPTLRHESIVVIADQPVLMGFGDLRGAMGHLRPSGQVRNAITRFPGRVDARWLGIHYRATDHRLGYPYREWILRILGRLKPIFVCSDDHEIEVRACRLPNVFALPKQSYPSKLDPTQDWNFGWNVFRSRQSLIEATADLYLLASCGTLLGTEKSSFFKFAKILGRHRLAEENILSHRYWRRKFRGKIAAARFVPTRNQS